MRVASSLIVSLILTTIISFVIPVAIVGLILGVATLISLIPGLTIFGHQAVNCIVEFLAVFGTGNPLSGVITLGLVSSFVGALFDLFNIYRFQSLSLRE